MQNCQVEINITNSNLKSVTCINSLYSDPLNKRSSQINGFLESSRTLLFNVLTLIKCICAWFNISIDSSIWLEPQRLF